MQEKREQVFRQWLTSARAHTPADVLRLHRNGSVGDPANNFVMQRERVRTVSITQVVWQKKYARMRFLEMMEGNHDERLVSIVNR